MGLSIAVMQPYFFPYAGYFRLFAAADLFVVLDCVQFPRRGWVHRNQLLDRVGHSQWLTLPIVKGTRDSTRICDLQFQPGAKQFLVEQIRRFPALTEVPAAYPALGRRLLDITGSPVEYLISTLKGVTDLLQISRPMIRSSDLAVSADLKGQSKILAIAKQVGAKHYINAPGGRIIYEAKAFCDAGLTLSFLTQYNGSFASVLERIAREDPASIAREIKENLSLDRLACS